MSDRISNVTTLPVTTAHVCLKLLGRMTACTYVVQYPRICLRPLQMWLASVYSPRRHHLDSTLMIPPPSHRFVDLVERPRISNGRHTLCCPSNIHYSSLRCTRPGVRSPPCQSQDSRPLVPGGTCPAYKCQVCLASPDLRQRGAGPDGQH